MTSYLFKVLFNFSREDHIYKLVVESLTLIHTEDTLEVQTHTVYYELRVHSFFFLDIIAQLCELIGMRMMLCFRWCRSCILHPCSWIIIFKLILILQEKSEDGIDSLHSIWCKRRKYLECIEIPREILRIEKLILI